jgi:hypothetical protein
MLSQCWYLQLCLYDFTLQVDNGRTFVTVNKIDIFFFERKTQYTFIIKAKYKH